ncbi:MAG: polyprenyl synthetase family protein [Parvibaculaceae bacterium]
MTFETSLKTVASEIDSMLDRLLPLETAKARRVVEAMRYSALAQGKRLRPFFVTETARLLGADAHGALRTGCALECVHCYSLVHDDLPAMDDDDLRRGKPTCHKAFDEATAILAGDGLLTFAFEILGEPETHSNPKVRIELVLELARAAGHAGMVGGQMLDLEAEEKATRDLDQIILLQSLKTGALFRYSCEAGAILAEADGEVRKALRTYADAVGLAFQIADDILDVESTPETLGKATQKDSAAGKATFIDLYGLEGAKSRARSLVAEACGALDRFGARADVLKEAARFIVDRKN